MQSRSTHQKRPLVVAILVVTLLAAAVKGQSYDQYEGSGGGDYGGYQDDQQQYNDNYYSQSTAGDTLYQDYAEHQEMKAHGGDGRGGGGWVTMAGVGMAGWFVGGKFHSRRAVKKSTKKHQSDLSTLYSKYIQDVTTLQKQIEELDKFIKESTRTQLADEFSRADYDENNKVSRAEFDQYKREYIRKHPDMADQFPAFEEFDPDHNGMITLREHQSYYEERGMI